MHMHNYTRTNIYIYIYKIALLLTASSFNFTGLIFRCLSENTSALRKRLGTEPDYRNVEYSNKLITNLWVFLRPLSLILCKLHNYFSLTFDWKRKTFVDFLFLSEYFLDETQIYQLLPQAKLLQIRLSRVHWLRKVENEMGGGIGHEFAGLYSYTKLIMVLHFLWSSKLSFSKVFILDDCMCQSLPMKSHKLFFLFETKNCRPGSNITFLRAKPI